MQSAELTHAPRNLTRLSRKTHPVRMDGSPDRTQSRMRGVNLRNLWWASRRTSWVHQWQLARINFQPTAEHPAAPLRLICQPNPRLVP